MPSTTLPANATGLPASRPDEITRAPADFTQWPQVFALRLQGSCMHPILKDDDLLVFDKTVEPEGGDLVGIWLNATTPEGEPALLCQVKRMSMDAMPGLRFPVRMSGDIMPLLCFEQINPPRYYSIRCDKVLALHKVIGVQRRNGRIDKTPLKRNATALAAERASYQTSDMIPVGGVQ